MLRAFKTILMAGLLATLLFQTGCISYRRKPKKLFREALALNRPFDAIIVPGVPFHPAAWDTIMKARVLWSYILYKNGLTKNVIYSGGAVYSPYYEAKIMGLYAQALGIPPEHIFYDTLAEHSTENIYFSYELARTLGFKTLALATDPMQASFTKSFVHKKFETKIYILPFVIDSLKQYNHLNPGIDPATAIKDSFNSIMNRHSFWKRFRGTLGHDIPWKNKETKKAEKL